MKEPPAPRAKRAAAPADADQTLDDIAGRVARHMLSAKGNWLNRKQDEWRQLYTYQ